MVATVDAEILDISFEIQGRERKVMETLKRSYNLLITIECIVYRHIIYLDILYYK